jgi:hypothetical protein
MILSARLSIELRRFQFFFFFRGRFLRKAPLTVQKRDCNIGFHFRASGSLGLYPRLVYSYTIPSVRFSVLIHIWIPPLLGVLEASSSEGGLWTAHSNPGTSLSF